jgi:hypothetical protein
MTKKEIKEVSVPIENITGKIFLIRSRNVMLDRDLAALYKVETKVLKQAVRRNIDRFPSDFMFELTGTEFKKWRSQFVTSKGDRMGLRYKPMVFTEQGVAMLSSVLRSKRAIRVNIQIMRAFIKLRQMYISNKDLKRKLAAMERKYDEQFQIVFEAIKQLIEEDEQPKRKIGYVKEKQATYGKRPTKKKQSIRKSTKNAPYRLVSPRLPIQLSPSFFAH